MNIKYYFNPLINFTVNYNRRYICCGSVIRSRNTQALRWECSYSETEETEILSKINSLSVGEMDRHPISKTVMERIVEARKVNGDFNKISDILDVRGIGVQTLQNVCNVMLNRPNSASQKISKKRKFGQIISPPLTSIENIESACGMFVNLDTVAWAEITKQNELKSWDIIKFNLTDEMKIGIELLMENVWSACENVPKSSVYIMESFPKVLRSTGGDTNNPKTVHINLQKAQMSAMLSASLNILPNIDISENDFIEDDHSGYENILKPFSHKVHYLRNSLPSRLFKTFVGNEKISCQSVVENILQQQSNGSSFYRPLLASHNVKMNYEKRDIVSKEILSQVLLLTMTFMELCIHTNADAFRALQN